MASKKDYSPLMTKTTLKEVILTKLPHSKEEFFYWSFFGSLALILVRVPGSIELSVLVRAGLLALFSGTLIFLYWLFIRWVGKTAEKAGRSFVAFMIFAILAPAIAWIVVIMFKKPQPIGPVA